MTTTTKVLLTIALVSTLASHATSQDAVRSSSRGDLRPGSCETNAAVLGNIQEKFLRESAESVVIVVAHLGDAEQSRELSRRRLFNVSYYLQTRLGIDANRLLVVEGERHKGFGRVDIYTGGTLSETLVAERMKDLCVTCCGDYGDFYPERIKRKK